MANNIFPERILQSSSGNTSFTVESIIAKLTYFESQFRLIHWQTDSQSIHEATGELVDYLHEFTDDLIEKFIGYTKKKPRTYKVDSVKDNVDPSILVKELEKYAHDTYEQAEDAEYCDIENKMQKLSGKAAKTWFLLTLS